MMKPFKEIVEDLMKGLKYGRDAGEAGETRDGGAQKTKKGPDAVKHPAKLREVREVKQTHGKNHAAYLNGHEEPALPVTDRRKPAK